MSDIVERLKQHSGWIERTKYMGETGEMLWDAIDEIESLRKRLAWYRKQVGFPEAGTDMTDAEVAESL